MSEAKRLQGQVMAEKKVRCRADLIANQMMKGGFAKLLRRNKVATDEEIAAFKIIHADTIRWVEVGMPRYINGGVMGAVGKGVLWYGKEMMLPFMEQLRSNNFKGRYDPAHVLYLWLNKNASKDTRDSYLRTVTAIRAHVSNKKIMCLRNGQEEMSHLVLARTDIFEWDDNYTIMVPPKSTGDNPRNCFKQAEETTVR